jgi:4-amino-4-deoxy-L-arabinose transferase-like glycosyltransferase
MKPVRLLAAATNALPRWALIALSLLYILPGLIGRDPWKNEDATGFGIMWTIAHGKLDDWLLLNVAGLDMPAESPLAYWFGAIAIKLFGGLFGDALAARIFTAICFLAASLSLWYATYLLGRRNEAQPLKLAFGGQPSTRDYGRTLADGAFLIFLGCIGLLLHSHETSPKVLQIALVCYALYGAVRVFDTKRFYHFIVLGISLGLLVLTRGWLLPVSILSGLVILGFITQRSIGLRLLALTLPATLLVCAAWILTTRMLLPDSVEQFNMWRSWNLYQLNLPTFKTLHYLVSYGVWFTWPAWPIAAWALYTWRQQLKSLHIAIPLAFIIPILVQILLNVHTEESNLLPLLPPLAMLAAFGLPTMKRGAINAVDWFSVLTLTLCAAFIWLGWIAIETGWPVKLSQNAAKLAPGYDPTFSYIALAVAVLTTIGWMMLVHWRLSRRPPVLWRAVVLSSGGVILCWVLLMTLWLPVVNYSKSYAGVAHQIAERLPPVKYCVTTNVGTAQRASFAYFAHIPFENDQGHPCDFLLLQDDISNVDDLGLLQQYEGRWHLIWEGRRPSDRDERFRLYRRVQ